jgi:hypothetical protein
MKARAWRNVIATFIFRRPNGQVAVAALHHCAERVARQAPDPGSGPIKTLLPREIGVRQTDMNGRKGHYE